jgi:hypothetical protein
MIPLAESGDPFPRGTRTPRSQRPARGFGDDLSTNRLLRPTGRGDLPWFARRSRAVVESRSATVLAPLHWGLAIVRSAAFALSASSHCHVSRVRRLPPGREPGRTAPQDLAVAMPLHRRLADSALAHSSGVEASATNSRAVSNVNAIGRVFGGESMFSAPRRSSKEWRSVTWSNANVCWGFQLIAQIIRVAA